MCVLNIIFAKYIGQENVHVALLPVFLNGWAILNIWILEQWSNMWIFLRFWYFLYLMRVVVLVVDLLFWRFIVYYRWIGRSQCFTPSEKQIMVVMFHSYREANYCCFLDVDITFDRSSPTYLNDLLLMFKNHYPSINFDAFSFLWSYRMIKMKKSRVII